MEDRYRYLRLQGTPAQETFGVDRYINQRFYVSREWKEIRDIVLVRDMGCDLGIPGREITERPTIHHMNPMRVEDIVHANEDILNPEFLITVTHITHNAIHYGNESQLPRVFEPRRPGDTKLW